MGVPLGGREIGSLASISVCLPGSVMERATAAACSRWPAWVNTPASTASAYGCWSGSVVERPTVSAWAATLAACSCWPAVGDVVAVAGKSEGGGEVGVVPGGEQVKSNGDLVQGGGIPASDVKHSLVPGGVSGTGRQPSRVAGDDQRPEVAAQQVFRGAAIRAAIIAAIKDTGYLHVSEGRRGHTAPAETVRLHDLE